MGRTSIQTMSLEERMRQNWINDLKEFGIEEGPDGESVQGMSKNELRRLVTWERLKRD